MSQHIASIEWNCRPSDDFKNNQYDRAHTWRFDGGFEMSASPSPSIVPIPFSNPDYVDPEEAFIASLASCHMLFFLHFAANKNNEVMTNEKHTTNTPSHPTWEQNVIFTFLPGFVFGTSSFSIFISLIDFYHIFPISTFHFGGSFDI